MKLVTAGVVALLLLPSLAASEVAKVTIASRVTVADGQAFGKVGPYEKLTGTIEFALDPADPHNRPIVDLQHAPRSTDGKVHFTSDLIVLRPIDAAAGNGVLLFDVANRGNLNLLPRFNSAAGSRNPETAADLGNGFLMREGYTLVWVGWEFDIVNGPRVEAPLATDVSDTITARLLLDAPAAEATLSDIPLYRPRDPGAATSRLTVRDSFWDTPTVIARDKWRFVETATGAPRIALDGGFEPGRMYEATFAASGARVVGVGMAAIRDAAAGFRYRTDLPVRGTAAYAFGPSQNGRFLRQFLHEGFNVDERGRKVFDAVWAHIAGAARGSFNDRFGQATSLSTFTATAFPFSVETQTLNGETGALLSAYRPADRPKLILSNTDVEYWGGGRAAALTHVSVDGTRDLAPSNDVRIYFLAGTQHGESAFPPGRTSGQELGNPTPQREVMRALLTGLHRWVSRGEEPPASRYPTLTDRTLTPVSSVRFPAIPGVANPRVIAGPGLVVKGKAQMLPFLVPQVDADGNDTGGIRVPDLSVPLATSTGWNFRRQGIGNHATEIYNLLGSYIPFAATRAERLAKKDPRVSVEERYAGKADYLQKIRVATAALIRERYLLEEDFDNVLARATAHWDYATTPKAPAAR